MNRDRIAAELPPEAAEWLTAYASDYTWTNLGRDLAIALGRRMLAGDPERTPTLRLVNETSPSPAVRHVAIEIRDGGHRWSAHRVAHELVEYFGLYGAQEHIQRSLGKSTRPGPGVAGIRGITLTTSAA